MHRCLCSMFILHEPFDSVIKASLIVIIKWRLRACVRVWLSCGADRGRDCASSWIHWRATIEDCLQRYSAQRTRRYCQYFCVNITWLSLSLSLSFSLSLSISLEVYQVVQMLAILKWRSIHNKWKIRVDWVNLMHHIGGLIKFECLERTSE